MNMNRFPTSERSRRYRPEDMDALVRQSGISLSAEQRDCLWSYHILLRRYTAELNLTRIHSFDNMVLKLYVDSMLPGTLIDLPSPLMDLGSGAGMPGIPLKIAFPDVDILLAESRAKRTEFLKAVLSQLSLDGISIVEKAITKQFEEPVRGVITRAVEPMAATLDRISGCLAREGRAIFMKGPHCDHEIKAAMGTRGQEFRLVQDIAYHIPHSPHKRRLVVFERAGEPTPRRRDAARAKHHFRMIESEDNAIFKKLKKILTGRGIKKHETALLSGRKTIGDVMRSSPALCEAWINTTQQEPPPLELPDHAAWYQLTPQLFKTIDAFGTDAPLLLIRTPAIPSWRSEEGLPQGCSLLLPFQDPENVGTAIRSAVAFGVHNIILLGECAHPYHPRSLRASGGAVLQARLLAGPSIRDLPDSIPIIPLSAEGADISGFVFPESFGLLPGIEGPGLPEHFRKNALSIPMPGRVESLNAAAATAIALYVWRQSRDRA
jgi:16S rRNA (guanine(527)-N(7))-methyltransferase RsmG